MINSLKYYNAFIHILLKF